MPKLKVSFWIDRPFALVRGKKYRHYRHQRLLKRRMPVVDHGRAGPRPLAVLAGWAKRLKVVKRLSRWWRLLENDALALWRRDTMAFEIGRPLKMGDRTWICTDIGTRTICAVLLDDLIGSSDTGPPYSIEEHVLDGYDMDGCEPASWTREHQTSP